MTRVLIDGAVDAPAPFDLAALAGLPSQIADVGALVPKRVGGAVRLDAVLETVGVHAEAQSAVLTSADGHFTQSAPLASLRDAVLVYRLGDAPLPTEEGGPIRLLVPEAPGLVGVDRCTNVKAIGRITIRREPA